MDNPYGYTEWGMELWITGMEYIELEYGMYYYTYGS